MPSSPGSPSKFSSSTAAPTPVDYSFKELKAVNDLLHEEPVSGSAKHPAILREANVAEYLDGLANAEKSTSSAHSNCSVRICNNHIGSLQGLDKVLNHVLEDPGELVWLDASCNQLTSIEDVVTKFPKLQVLYLHGNLITSLHDVLKLTKLEHLQKLTLHGNPVSEHKLYKMWVCAHLPKLRSLDFSTITRIDRDKVAVWHRGYLKQQAAKQ